MSTIQKLIDRNIFKAGTLIEAPVKKRHMGDPVILTKTLRVAEVRDTYCIADEEFEIEAETPMLKIKYENIQTVDGMEPDDLAAVYGLVPKTERFKRKDLDK